MSAPASSTQHVHLEPGALAALAAAYPERYPVLLDSAADGALSRHSILAAFPRAALWREADGRVFRRDSDVTGDRLLGQGNFLSSLDDWWRAEGDTAASGSDLPFSGGWLVYLGYETAGEIEPRLRLPAFASGIDAFALRIAIAVIQRADGSAVVVAEAGVPDEQLAQLHRDIAALPRIQFTTAGALPAVNEEAPDAFTDRVIRTQEYIRAGDVYQANLSRPWRSMLDGQVSTAQLYARLRAANPAPFAALAQFRGLSILSSSPERLLRIHGRHIDTRPIAGTHPRGKTVAEDRALAAALLAHPKERAEHVMLIDLERNDLGRVCVAGSVEVDEYMGVETYAHVHHIVSNVRGVLRPDVTPVDALRAVFPGGTITGCPKLRCMEIIAELEGEARGAYTGSLGYLNLDGSADFNILIRTITLRGKQLEFRAGAGIVADSDPQRELAETRSKARGMLAALELAAPLEPRR